MKPEILAHVTREAEPGVGWNAQEWAGSKAYNTPVAWNRYWSFVGLTMTVIIMSDDWTLTYETAREIAIAIARGERSYWSYPLNEDKPQWKKIW